MARTEAQKRAASKYRQKTYELRVAIYPPDKDIAALGYGPGYYHKYGFKLVMDRLDRESQRPDPIFRKGYICYNGIINRPTRCFTVIDK